MLVRIESNDTRGLPHAQCRRFDSSKTRCTENEATRIEVSISTRPAEYSPVINGLSCVHTAPEADPLGLRHGLVRCCNCKLIAISNRLKFVVSVKRCLIALISLLLTEIFNVHKFKKLLLRISF